MSGDRSQPAEQGKGIARSSPSAPAVPALTLPLRPLLPGRACSDPSAPAVPALGSLPRPCPLRPLRSSLPKPGPTLKCGRGSPPLPVPPQRHPGTARRSRGAFGARASPGAAGINNRIALQPRSGEGGGPWRGSHGAALPLRPRLCARLRVYLFLASPGDENAAPPHGRAEGAARTLAGRAGQPPPCRASPPPPPPPPCGARCLRQLLAGPGCARRHL